jgi:hypothetical protein
MGFLMKTSGILMRQASRWALLQLRELLLELTVLAGLGQYSQAIENGLQLSSVLMRWGVQFHHWLFLKQ